MDFKNLKMYINSYGTKYWKNSKGQFHRKNGPAMEFSNGSKSWYKEGKLHRLGGPAYEGENGDREWYVNGKCNRVDGPACEYRNEDKNEDKEWYINNIFLKKEEFNSWIKRIQKCI